MTDRNVNLDQYCVRIGYAGALAPTLETLRGLHLAHAQAIPFENLDILLGRPIRLDPPSIWTKLVLNRRGGYCFEQNALFASVLEAVGFRVRTLCGRVQMGSADPRPRTHMVLAVDLDDESWLADVGFGGEGLLHPLPLRPGQITKTFSWENRIADSGHYYTLQSRRREGWFDLYRFTEEPQHAIDYEVANHYTSTHPGSTFVQKLVASRPGIDARVTLRNRTMFVQTPDGITETILPDDAALLEVLRTRFGLEFPAGTRFAYQD